MSDAARPIRRGHLRLIRSNDMAEQKIAEIRVKRLDDVMHSRSTGLIAIMIADESGHIDRVVMSGELAEKLHQMLGNALAGARQNPAAP
jgi:hypothetical protein